VGVDGPDLCSTINPEYIPVAEKANTKNAGSPCRLEKAADLEAGSALSIYYKGISIA
jgi:hypothetical protein